ATRMLRAAEMTQRATMCYKNATRRGGDTTWHDVLLECFDRGGDRTCHDVLQECFDRRSDTTCYDVL
ncbi:MAG: hypothetical protein AB8I58_09600, partial [Anaerolineales bacterium]